MAVLFTSVHTARNGYFSPKVVTVGCALAVARDILINGLII